MEAQETFKIIEAKMSWEIVTLISVLAVCFSMITVFALKYKDSIEPNIYATKEQHEALDLWVSSIEKSVAALEKNSEALQKTHDETKKLLSQANLAGAIRGVR